MFSEYLSIGEVLKPQGVHGQVKVRPDTNDPARFSHLQQVLTASTPCRWRKTSIISAI